MRWYLFLPVIVVALFFSLLGCESLTSDPTLEQDTSSDDAALPDSVRQRYADDAARLTARYLQEHEPETDEVDLPDDRVQRVYDALMHVYNAGQIAARDAIEGIHTFPRVSLYETLVALDTTVAWTDAWRAGERLTGEPDVDALVETYELSVEYNSEASQPVAVVQSEEPIYTPALSRRFAEIGGVTQAEPNGTAGDGNDIEAVVEEDAVLLTYSRGEGDCPSGCIYREAWTFRVDAEGVVRFVGHQAP